MSEQLQDASKGSLPWWVQLCRWLKARLLYVWGTLFVGILVSTIANLNTTTTDTPLSRLFLVHLALTYPIPIFASLGVLFLLTLLSLVGSRERDSTMPLTLSEQNRTHMLRRLRLRYEQMMAQSLQGAAQVELGLAERSAEVQNATSLALRLPDQPEKLLPPQTKIREAYNRAQQELLILGEPGAGKSTMLLELAHYLVEQAEQDAAQPLPVLLPLSSWATNHRPLQDWIVEQCTLLYDVPRRLSQQWVQGDLILPLLDGLDEMKEASRAACIVAINTFHRKHLQPLVVCSRSREYETAAKQERLALHMAVMVQPLSQGQVDAYLAEQDESLAALRRAIKKNPTLAELATTPLMLQVLMLTYQGTPVWLLSRQQAVLQLQIWTAYVQRMVMQKGDAERYPLNCTVSWLAWLARLMRDRSLTIFSLNYLHSNDLPKTYAILSRWINGLITGLFSGFFGGLFFGLFGGLFSGFFGGLFFEIFGGLDRELFIVLFAWLTYIQSIKLINPRGPNIIKDTLLARSEQFSFFSGDVQLLSSSGVEVLRIVGMLLLPGGLGIGLGVGLGIGITSPLSSTLLLSGLFFVLSVSLLAVVQRYILRFWLALSGVIPWKAVPFLEDATARILLRQVGGGYSFTHRLLLDYFADMDTAPPSPSTEVKPIQQTPQP